MYTRTVTDQELFAAEHRCLSPSMQFPSSIQTLTDAARREFILIPLVILSCFGPLPKWAADSRQIVPATIALQDSGADHFTLSTIIPPAQKKNPQYTVRFTLTQKNYTNTICYADCFRNDRIHLRPTLNTCEVGSRRRPENFIPCNLQSY